MQQLTQEEPKASVVDILVQLRQSLAGADPLTSSESEPFLTQARTLAHTLDTESDSARQALLLRALDDAIAAIELAASVADTVHAASDSSENHTNGGGHGESMADPLLVAYRAFAESQPTFQALYHYRNALAEHLRSTLTGAGGE